jgi:hypothetical protein
VVTRLPQQHQPQRCGAGQSGQSSLPTRGLYIGKYFSPGGGMSADVI